MKIVICMPTMGSIPTQMVMFLQGMDKPSGVDVSLTSTIRSPIMLARNELIRQALIQKADKLVFLDDDNPPEQRDFIKKLLDTDKKIISGLVPSRTPDGEGIHRICVFGDGERETGEHFYNQYVNVHKDDVFEISNCGAGCVMIDRECLAKVYDKFEGHPCEMRYMRYRKTPHGDISEDDIDYYKLQDGMIRYRKYVSEDVLLFERIKRLGYKLHATKNVTCKHLSDGKWISIDEHITYKNKDLPLLLGHY